MHLRSITLLGIITSMVTGVTLGVMLSMRTQVADPDAVMLEQVFEHVSAHYVDEVSRAQLVDDALRGMVDGLDQHSKYLDPDIYSEMKTDATGRFGGIGIELGLVDGFFTVIRPIPNTPAARAGVQAGDRVTAIDGESLRGQRLSDVIDTLRGEPGQPVHIKTSRAGEVRELALTRDEIELQSVFAQEAAPGYIHVRISQFHKDTHAHLLQALTPFQAQGIILDLRNNPGGLLGASVDVASEFLEGGLVVTTKGRDRSNFREYHASAEARFADTPVVVLINGRSASAAEIVAGALRDHNRATLIGAKTYGKGSVQSVLPLPGQRGVKLTTAFYHTPNGEAIHNQGISPDIETDQKFDALVKLALKHLQQNAVSSARQ